MRVHDSGVFGEKLILPPFSLDVCVPFYRVVHAVAVLQISLLIVEIVSILTFKQGLLVLMPYKHPL
jgi:hypothetical protein